MDAQNLRSTGHVVVAVDGSPAADNAVDWAADEAALRGVALEVLHAWEWKAYEASDWYGHHLHNHGTALLEAAAERARLRRPGTTVTTSMPHGDADEILADAAQHAGLMVTGSRGLGGFGGMLLGSHSRNLAALRACPLLVVRSGAEGGAEPAYDEDYFRIDKDAVVVGVADDTCRPAVEAAFAEAARRGARVHAVHAWSFPELPVYGLASQAAPTAEAIRSCEQNGEAILTGTVGPVSERFPDVDHSLTVVNGRRAKVMVDASRDATLVVAATHRRPGRIGRQLGPVTHALLHHAHAPVLLIPVG